MTTAHAHEHHHGHEGHAFGGVGANQAYFNEFAEKFEDIPGAREILAKIAEAMKDVHQFDPESSVMMDFACGTGSHYAALDFCYLHRSLI